MFYFAVVAPASKFWGQIEGARHFFGGGARPSRVISFDHFIHENAIFLFLISQKDGHFYLDFTETWGHLSPLPPGATTATVS